MDRGRIQPWRPNGASAKAGSTRTATHAEPRAELVSPSGDLGFEDLWARENLSLADLDDERMLVSWRLIRQVARARGLCREDQFLFEATSISPDPWTEPVGYFEQSGRWFRHGLRWPDLPLLPPDVPAADIENEKVRVGYDPREDGRLRAWISMMESAARQLSLGSRSVDHYGLSPVLDPCLCRTAVPAPEDLMLVEQALVEEALEIHLDKGVYGLVSDAKHRWGLTRFESLSLFRLALRKATSRTCDNPEQNLALMTLRLERIAAKARNTLDLRAELMALKLLSIIQGLANVEADDQVKDINESVRELTERRKMLISNGKEAS